MTTDNGIKYFHMVYRYLNFNGQVFGETLTTQGISAFKDIKRIDSLEAFPLKFYPRQKEIVEYIVKCGKIFVNLMGQYHVQYRGNAFYRTDGSYVEVPVDSRIMVDVFYFRKVNPNYVRPVINKLARSDLSRSHYVFPNKEADQVKSNDFNSVSLSEDDLIICSQTVYDWNFGNKQWRRSPNYDNLKEKRFANVMRNGIPGKLHRQNRVEPIYFPESYDPRRT